MGEKTKFLTEELNPRNLEREKHKSEIDACVNLNQLKDWIKKNLV